MFAWLRKCAGEPPVAVICNMTPMLHDSYGLGLPVDGTWAEILNTDAREYGGSGKGNMGEITVKGGRTSVVLPPLSTIMLEYKG